MSLGLYYWRTTKDQAAKGITGDRNLVEVMMQTKDKKREREFSTKELWLEVFLLGAVGKLPSPKSSLPQSTARQFVLTWRQDQRP